MNNESDTSCQFCGSPFLYTYKMLSRSIGRCQNCKTIGVINMPEKNELDEYYQGFSYQNNPNNIDKLLTNDMKQWMVSVMGKNNGRMLDIGGGGGFFAKAFENFGLGEAVVVDIDADSCEFAKEELGLKRVYQMSVEEPDFEDLGKFDFIYCRHVIEHLINPMEFIKRCSRLLEIGSVLVIQCPNGQSKEQALLYPERWKSYLAKVKRDNKWSKLYSVLFSFTSKYGFGLEPLRHLWAISAEGLESGCNSIPNVNVTMKTAALCDSVFSPYYKSSSQLGFVRDKLDRLLVPGLISGSHLIAEIRKVS